MNGVVSYAKKEYEDILRHHQILLGSNGVSLMDRSTECMHKLVLKVTKAQGKYLRRIRIKKTV